MTKSRLEYSDTLKWNVKDLYENTDSFNASITKLENDLPKYAEFKGHLTENSTSLYDFLVFNNEFEQELEKICIYAQIVSDQDTTETANQVLEGKALNLYSLYSKETSFVVPELLKTDYKVIVSFIEENPKLKEFERSLKETYRFQKYVLSAKEEYILSNMLKTFNTPESVYSYLTDADLKFGKIKNQEGTSVELSEKNYREFLECNDRNVRKNAFNKLLKTYANFKNTYAELLMNEVSNNNKMASLRGYKSALTKSLYANEIPEEIYPNLIAKVKKNVEPLSRFWKLKADILGVKNLHIYDVFAPLVKKASLKYSETEAEELLYQALDCLGPTYINDLKKAFKEKWIDFCPNKGKRNGAYCTACYKVHPYVLLSYDGSLNSVSTLAHELGHAMHYYYAIKNQKYQDYNYSIFVAEVASQVNQILLSKYLIKNAKDVDVKKCLIDDLISDFKSTIYRQTMFAEFEKIIHEEEAKGNVLTHEDLESIYYKLNKEYYGKNIVVDDVIKYEWERIPHFYMNFYVYQYATAYAAAIKIALDLWEEKAGSREKYLEFLSLGCTKDPITSLKIAGVDVDTMLDTAFSYFDNLIDELEALMNRGNKNE